MSNPIENHDKIKFIDEDTSPFNVHAVSTKNLLQWAEMRGARSFDNGRNQKSIVFVITDEYNILGVTLEHGYSSGWGFDMSNIYDVSIISINDIGEDVCSFDRDKKLREYGYKLWGMEYYIEVSKKSPIFISYDDAKACLNLIIRKKIQALQDRISEINKHINRIHDGKISIDLKGFEVQDGDAKLSISCETKNYKNSRESQFSPDVFIEIQEIFSKQLNGRVEVYQSKVSKLEKKLL